MTPKLRQGTRFTVHTWDGLIGTAVYVGSWVVCDERCRADFARRRLVSIGKGGSLSRSLESSDLPPFRILDRKSEVLYESEGYDEHA